MENVVATFTAVYPYFIPVTNGVGFAYEITLINQGTSSIAADAITIDVNFGTFGHPVQNSVFLASINGGAGQNAFALATPYTQAGATTRVKIGFAADTQEAVKALLPDKSLVLRLLTPAAYDDYVEPIERSIVVTAI